jgi:hypothetical protein
VFKKVSDGAHGNTRGISGSLTPCSLFKVLSAVDVYGRNILDIGAGTSVVLAAALTSGASKAHFSFSAIEIGGVLRISSSNSRNSEIFNGRFIVRSKHPCKDPAKEKPSGFSFVIKMIVQHPSICFEPETPESIIENLNPAAGAPYRTRLEIENKSRNCSNTPEGTLNSHSGRAKVPLRDGG